MEVTHFIVDETQKFGLVQETAANGICSTTRKTVEQYLKDKPQCRVVTWEELSEIEAKRWITPFTEITEDQFWRGFEMLPPFRTRSSVGYFIAFCPEMTSGVYSTCWLKADGKYYACTMSALSTSEQVIEKFKKDIQ